MGGGDLNMKKSWHPLLMKNQERVWLEEKKALEEKKKLDQLRKEKEEERQLQELQRMQEEQTGRKRTERLEWMYSTPATGGGTNKNDLEDYLLGKKRVDKILVADENDKVGAAHKNFIAVQNANTVRDIAAKIREDPLLAIKQQEQAAYQSLLSNPLRLKEMQMRNGTLPKEKKEKKKEKKHKEKKEKKHKHREERDEMDHDDRAHRRSQSPTERDYRRRDSRSPPRRHHHSEFERRRSESPRPRRDERDREFGSRFDSKQSYRRSPSPSRRGRSPADKHHELHSHRYSKSDETSSDEQRRRSRSRSVERRRPSPYHQKRSRSLTPPFNTKRPRATSPPRRAQESRPSNGYSASADERAARLAAMSSNANTLTADRKERLTNLLVEEKLEREAEEERRAKVKGMSGFLLKEQSNLLNGSGGIEETFRRGKMGYAIDKD